MKKKSPKMPSKKFLNPVYSLDFTDLYSYEGLKKLHEIFLKFLQQKNQNLHQKYLNLQEFDSETLIEIAKILEQFLADLFLISAENSLLIQSHYDLEKIYQARLEYIQRYISKKYSAQNFELSKNFDSKKTLEYLGISSPEIDEIEKNIARQILEEKNLELIEQYCLWALYCDEGKSFHKSGALFILPQKTDPQNLIGKIDKRDRQGFELTDKGYSRSRALAEANYCIICHQQKKDSCRTGLLDKQTNKNKTDSLGIELSGCPLDEKISEMNLLKKHGLSIAALAMAVIDNPMVAGTGHRICNDCTKSCIFQKQEPVDIPQIETRTLKDVLSLPYGFEIYSLLTRWNPLRFNNPLPKPLTGKKILVCGLGPAGYTLAHYLLNEGHEVVAIDGLKIEPLNPEISGIDQFSQRKEFRPIKFLDEIYEPLSKRVIGGFGGVSEYGITARFDKNFLKIIRLILERRSNFKMFGGIRFGSSITDKTAFEKYGFDHIALCIGAGRPNILNIKNNFAKGVRLASDFLMSLQLTGAFKENLFTNLQIRLPIVVIGGGLTAVDTACEAQAYYFTQIKKFANYVAKIGKEKIFAKLNQEELLIAEEFLKDEKKLREGDKNFIKTKILYRKKITDSQSYRLNHQELHKAFEEGVEFIENTSIDEIIVDEFNHVKEVKSSDGKIFPCRSLLVAIGTSPNISPAVEDGLSLSIDGKYFSQLKDESLFEDFNEGQNGKFNFITKFDKSSNKAISFFGDLHPNFEGNVVKAMASAKNGYHQISKILELSNAEKDNSKTEKNRVNYHDYNKDFLVSIHKIERLSDNVVEVFVKAPLIANQTEVGQIFRLQNYHALAQEKLGQIMAMEGVAVTALSIDKENGIISGIVVETGGSTSLIKNFRTGEPCVFMGPSGKPTEIPHNETVVFVGGGRGNQPLTALAEAFSANGCKVIFFAGYRKNNYIVRHERMKNSCSELIISIEDELAKDGFFQGSVIDSIKNYFQKNPQKIDRIFAIGNNRLMHEVFKLRHENIIPEFAKAFHAISSLNASMQCMMKGVCAQCLQKRTNEKGEIEYFYSCANQDQDSDKLDFQHLHNRCEQNSLAEKASRSWIEYLVNS